MKKTVIQLLCIITLIVGKTTISSDSVQFISPKIYSNLNKPMVDLSLLVNIEAIQVFAIIDYPLDICDTVELFSGKNKSVFSKEFRFSNSRDADALSLRLGYLIFSQNGDTIISRPRTNRWVRFNGAKAKGVYTNCKSLYKTEKIIIDARLDDWKDIQKNFINKYSNFMLRWNSTDLFIAVEILDSAVTIGDIVEISLNLAKQDSLFLDNGQRIMTFGPKRRSFTISFDRSGAEPIQMDSVIIRMGDEMEWMGVQTSSGYIIEIRVPFVLLADLSFPPPEFTLDITIINDDKTRGEKTVDSWSSIDAGSRHLPINWGRVRLKQNYFILKLTLLAMFFFFVITALFLFIYNIYRKIKNDKIEAAPIHSRLLVNILQEIKESCKDNNYDILELSTKISCTKDDIKKIINNELDTSFEKLLIAERVRFAKSYLLDFQYPIDEIYKIIGFKTNKDFIDSFSNISDVNPQMWRRFRLEEKLLDQFDEENDEIK